MAKKVKRTTYEDRTSSTALHVAASVPRRWIFAFAWVVVALLLLPSPAHAQQITPCPATGNAAPHFSATYNCYTHKTLSPAMLAVSSAGAAAIVGVTIWAVRRHRHHHAAAALPPAPQPHTDPCMIDGLWVSTQCAQQVKP
jgi:hypothetical protein